VAFSDPLEPMHESGVLRLGDRSRSGGWRTARRPGAQRLGRGVTFSEPLELARESERSRANAAVQGFVLRHDGGGGKKFAGALLGSSAELRTQRRILNQGFDRLDMFVHGAKGDEETADLIFDDFGNSAHA